MKIRIIIVAGLLSIFGSQTVRPQGIPDSNGNGMHFVSGPADGADVALSGARTFARGSAPGNLQSRPPLAVYDFKSDEVANGKGLETSQLETFQYLIEASGVFVGAADVRRGANGRGSQLVRFGLGRFGPLTVKALDELAKSDIVKKDSYEVRLINAPSLQLVAVWLKSSKGRTDLVYPLSEAFSRVVAAKLYTVDDFLKPFVPAPALKPWTSDDEMHAYFVAQFVASQGNGITRVMAPAMVIVDSMRMTLGKMPSDTYRVERLELLGVANHKPPVAYLVKRHNNYVESDAETRATTDFEQSALKDFQAGRNIVARADKGARIVVGAVRAQQACLECHKTYGVGDVLGAFSYRLSPVPNL